MFGVLIISAKLQSTFDCTPREPDHQNRLANEWMNEQQNTAAADGMTIDSLLTISILILA
jgi:hypothetical protein